MSEFLHILKLWLATSMGVLLGTVVFSLFFMRMLAKRPLMRWTRPDQVPASHRLLNVSGSRVNYQGDAKHPLPLKFALFEGGYFYLVVGSIWTVYTVSTSHENTGYPLYVMLAWSVALQLGVALLIHVIFRKLQPLWLNQHLASLK